LILVFKTVAVDYRDRTRL